jgi:tight adherence protein C
MASAGALAFRAAGLTRMRVGAQLEQAAAYGYVEADGSLPQELDPLIERVAERLGNHFGSDVEDPGTRSLMMSAGMYEMTARKLLGYRVLATLAVPTAVMYMVAAAGAGVPMRIAGVAVAMMLSWRLPTIVAEKRASRRQAEIDYEMPELIDSLIVTVEGGMGFSGALRTAAARTPGSLGDEMRFALREQDMGLAMDAALKNLVNRVDTPSMRSFVRSVLQAETLGVPVGEILRALAVEMRARRRADAEERAMKAPVKMLFPLVGLIFPAMFIVLLYPGITQMTGSMGGT